MPLWCGNCLATHRALCYDSDMQTQLTHDQHAIPEQHGDAPMPVVDPFDKKGLLLGRSGFIRAI